MTVLLNPNNNNNDTSSRMCLYRRVNTRDLIIEISQCAYRHKARNWGSKIVDNTQTVP